MSDIQRIVPFLLEANQAGYANDAPLIQTFDDGEREINYVKENLSFKDNWWGGNPFAGQESVAIDGKTIWSMQYRGWMEAGHEEMAAETFKFLRHALKLCSEDEPLRGPKEYKEDDYMYANSWGSNLDNFHGQEKIWARGEHVYTCVYFGGVVDL